MRASPGRNTVTAVASEAWIKGKLYVAGGWDTNADPLASTEVYDPATDSWSTLADNPKPHAAAGTAVVDNKLCLVGGCDASCGSTDVEIYDPATNRWSSGTDYPQSTSWGSCGGIDGILYCAGGVNDDAETAAGFAYDGTRGHRSPTYRPTTGARRTPSPTAGCWFPAGSSRTTPR